MHEKQMNITCTYHFLAEGIIIYLALLPFNFYHYGSVSVWAYLAILFGTGLVYSFISLMTASYIPFIATIPVIFLLYFMIGYPLFLSIVFAGLFAWRMIAIRSKGFLGYESTYLAATLLLTILGIFIMRDLGVVVLFVTQIFVVLLGFSISNLVVAEKENQRAFHKSEWLKWGGYFLGFTTLIYLLSDSLSWLANKIWIGIGNGLTLFAGGVAEVFDWLGLSNFFKSGIEQLDPMDGETGLEVPEPVGTHSFDPSEGDYFDILLAVSIGLIILFLIFIIYKGMKAKVYEKDTEEPIGYNIREEEATNKGRFIGRSFKRKRVKPNHPVRKLVYEFERKAAKSELGRMQHESIENWFDRIGLEGDIQVYQKVRYGDQSTSVKEEELLKRMLKIFEKSFPKNTTKEDES